MKRNNIETIVRTIIRICCVVAYIIYVYCFFYLAATAWLATVPKLMRCTRKILDCFKQSMARVLRQEEEPQEEEEVSEKWTGKKQVLPKDHPMHGWASV